jgi:hypothetical protein
MKKAYLTVAFGIVATFALLTLAPTAPADDAKDWGTIKGQVVYGGATVPEPKEITIDKDQGHCLEKGKLYSEDWVINKDNKGVRWVFVWLTTEPKSDKKLPVHPSLKDITVKEVELDQPRCQFIPHALGLREGQVLVAKNSSPVGHNVNYTGHPAKNPGKNLALAAGDSLKVDNLKADEKIPVTVACNIHPWMKAYVRVFDHPYFVVTDADGKFEIKNAPAGDWRLKVWHDSGWKGGADGRDGDKITVKGGDTTDVGKLELK